jgi:hypothetical protein
VTNFKRLKNAADENPLALLLSRREDGQIFYRPLLLFPMKVKVKQSRYRPEVAQRVAGN